MSYNNRIENNNIDLQAILNIVKNLPEEGNGVELPDLTNEGTAADLLAGKELIDGDGNIVTGEIPTKTASNLTVSGATVTVPAGYYATQATKSVATATRADTTISVTADDTNDKLTITGSNNQATGYVTGANKTASTAVTLTASGKTVTATATNGTKVSKDVTSGFAKTPATTITKTPSITVNSSGLITASVSGTQSVTPTVTAGYVSSGTAGTITVSGSATKQLTTQAAKTITPSTSSQTAVASGRYTTGAITVAGDANLVPENIKNGISIFGVEGNAEGDSSADSIVTGTIVEYENSTITSIRNNAFANCGSLKTISFPKVTTIGAYAFESCSALTTISFPQATRIGFYAFASCITLKTASFPQATTMEIYAFASCRALTTISFPKVTTLGSYAFASCRALKTASFPQVTSIGSQAFVSCSSLTTVSFPQVTTLGSYAFESCSALKTASFPQATSIGYGGFYGCANLETVSFPKMSTIEYQAFGRCYNLSQIYLMGSQVCNLRNSQAFISTPFAGYSASFSGTPHIYVPASLVDAYKKATNWTYFANYIAKRPEITFTISNSAHTAYKDATWGEWVNSAFNTEGYLALEDGTIGLNGKTLMFAGTPVSKHDSIKAYFNYTLTTLA